MTSTLQSLRYHLFRICTGILNHEVILENELRNKLIQYSLQYCGYGPYQQENLERIKKYKENMTEKIKDNEQIEKMKNEFYYFTQLVKYWANKSIPFILSTKTRVTSVLNQSNSSNSQSLLHHQTTASSSATSNVNTSNNSVPTGQGAANNAPTAGGIINQLNTAQTQEIDDVFQYATSVFTSCEDVIIKQTGRNSIIKTLNHVSYEAQERIIDRCIDECYTNKVNIVKEFFLVIFYAITKKSDLQFKLTNIVNLSFYIMSDNDPSLRKLATDLLYWISTRFYKTARNPILLFNSNSSSRYLSQLVCPFFSFFSSPLFSLYPLFCFPPFLLPLLISPLQGLIFFPSLPPPLPLPSFSYFPFLHRYPHLFSFPPLHSFSSLLLLPTFLTYFNTPLPFLSSLSFVPLSLSLIFHSSSLYIIHPIVRLSLISPPFFRVDFSNLPLDE